MIVGHALGRVEVPDQVPAGDEALSRGSGRKRKRRIRSPHPGVVLLPPDGTHTSWRARYVDADTGRQTKVRLDPIAVPTAETRRDWAIRKAKAMAKRRDELDHGAARATGTGLDVALDRYFEDHAHLRGGTLGIYKQAADKLRTWARSVGIRTADDVTGPKLVAFAATLRKEKRLAKVPGGKRGEVKRTNEPRSANTVNRELRSVRTVLGYLRSLGLLPKITSDDLKDSLKRMEVSQDVGDFLRVPALQALLGAALEHDAKRFAATRAELRGILPPGSTPKYEAIAPVILAAALTGMRLGELVGLTWPQVDLAALGDDGKPAGEITLKAAGTKTKRGRVVTLDHSPTLRFLLEALRPENAKGNAWGLTRGQAVAAAKRLDDYDAPDWSWQALRRSAGTYLTNAPGIFGGSSAYRSAKLLGHSVQVAERHYVGLVRVSREAKTLEAAMQIEELAERVIDAAKARMR